MRRIGYVVRFWDTRGRLRSSIRVEDGVYKYYIKGVSPREDRLLLCSSNNIIFYALSLCNCVTFP